MNTKTIKYRLTVITLGLLLFSGACQDTRSIKLISKKDFIKLNWQQRLNLFSGEEGTRFTDYQIPMSIYRESFQDDHPPVTIAALNNLTGKESTTLRTEIYGLLKSPHAIIRWKSCKAISLSPHPRDLKYISRYFSDKEWLLRECAFKAIRKYPAERNKKKYYIRVLAGLDDRNPTVLKQIYQTIQWYNDDRSFPYLYKRSFHSKRNYETIVILRELVKFHNSNQIRIVIKRLSKLSRTHKSYFIRAEAKKLLQQLLY